MAATGIGHQSQARESHQLTAAQANSRKGLQERSERATLAPLGRYFWILIFTPPASIESFRP